MRETIVHAPLYTFLARCEESPLEKVILDCGAGGDAPPLALFHERGFETHGVDISEERIEKSRIFSAERGIDLGIIRGDMRRIPFEDESRSFDYSYATICHMTKGDVALAMSEIARVLKKGGLCFVTFCAVSDPPIGGDDPAEPGEYPFEEDGETIIHSIFADDEPDPFFDGLSIFRKEKQRVEKLGEDGPFGWTELLYFAKKNEA